MSTLVRRSRRALPLLATALLLVAATALWQRLPDSIEIYRPFDVPGQFGTATSGRTLTVTVEDVQLAQQVQGSARWSSPPPVAAAGRWVVVRASVSATTHTVLPNVELRVGPNTYRRSDRFPGYTLSNRADPGITQRGSWVFDVPAELVEPPGTAPVELRVWPGLDDRLDNRLVIDLHGHLDPGPATVTVLAPEVSG